jgi:hypothetical protein
VEGQAQGRVPCFDHILDFSNMHEP